MYPHSILNTYEYFLLLFLNRLYSPLNISNYYLLILSRCLCVCLFVCFFSNDRLSFQYKLRLTRFFSNVGGMGTVVNMEYGNDRFVCILPFWGHVCYDGMRCENDYLDQQQH